VIHGLYMTTKDRAKNSTNFRIIYVHEMKPHQQSTLHHIRYHTGNTSFKKDQQSTSMRELKLNSQLEHES
jgi:hypothetical protein